MESAITSVVSLAHLAWQTCATAEEYKEECVRIGERLMNLIVLTKSWTELIAKNRRRQKKGKKTSKKGLPSLSTLNTLKTVLSDLNLALQAVTTAQSHWTKKVIAFVQSQDRLDALLKAETDLNSTLQDFTIFQNLHNAQANAELNQRFDRVEEILMFMATRMSNESGSIATSGQGASSKGESLLEQMNAVLDFCQAEKGSHNPAKLQFAATGSTAGSSTTSMTTTSSNDTSSCASMMAPVVDAKDVTDDATDMEIQELELDLRKLKLGRVLGEGSFGRVYAGTYTGDRVAVKEFKLAMHMQPSPKAMRSVKRKMLQEAILMSRCGIHPHIVQVYGFSADGQEDVNSSAGCTGPLLVMERMKISFFEALHQKLLPTFAKRVTLLKGIAEALEFLHLQGIVHRDVKSMNILLTTDLKIARLSDFGEAKEKGLASTAFGSSAMMDTKEGKGNGMQPGTIAYQAPEILAGELKRPSRKAEIHAFGVVLWECLTSEIPHTGKQAFDIIRDAINPNVRYLLEIPKLSQRPKRAERMLWTTARMCLERDPTDRPTASRIVHLLGRRTTGAVAEPKPEPTIPVPPTPLPIIPTAPPVIANNDAKHTAQPVAPPETAPSIQALNLDEIWSKYKKWIIGGIIFLVVLIITVSATASESPSSTSSSRGSGSSSSSGSRPYIPRTAAPTSAPLPSVWSPFGERVDGDTPGDLFGTSVAMSSNGLIMAAGATGNDGNGLNSGQVRAFYFNETEKSWLQLGQTLTGEDPLDFFGENIVLSSNGLILALRSSQNSYRSGLSGGQVSVFRYHNDTETWDQLGQDLHGEDSGDNFGSSLALSSDGLVLAVGSPLRNRETGEVFVYSYDDGTDSWDQVGDPIDGIFVGDRFGSSVALSADGRFVAAGSIYHDDGFDERAGLVRVFSYDTRWTQLGRDLDGIRENDQLGTAVALSSDGQTLAVSGLAGWGRVYVYQYNPSSREWEILGEQLYDSSLSSFGKFVALSSDGRTVAAHSKGGVRLFEYRPKTTSWEEEGNPLRGIDFSATAIAFSSDAKKLVVGSSGKDDDDSGHVQVYIR